MTKPATPLYLFRGSSPLADADGSQLADQWQQQLLQEHQGRARASNRVPTSGRLDEYTFDDLQEREEQAWYSERNPLPATVFSWLPPAHSVDRQKLDDFIEPGGGDGWFMGDLEIVPDELAAFPDYSSLLPRADLRLPRPSEPTVPKS